MRSGSTLLFTVLVGCTPNYSISGTVYAVPRMPTKGWVVPHDSDTLVDGVQPLAGVRLSCRGCSSGDVKYTERDGYFLFGVADQNDPPPPAELTFSKPGYRPVTIKVKLLDPHGQIFDEALVVVMERVSR
jgi:hypothetical protein